MARTKNFMDVIRAEMDDDPSLAKSIHDFTDDCDIAEKLYRVRTEAGLSQRALADLIGTTQSVISRIEDADYGSQSLDILKRIADALKKRLVIEFCDHWDAPRISTVSCKYTAVSPQCATGGWEEYDTDMADIKVHRIITIPTETKIGTSWAQWLPVVYGGGNVTVTAKIQGSAKHLIKVTEHKISDKT